MTHSHEWLRPQGAAPWWSPHLRRGAASAILCVAVFVGCAPTVVRAAGVVGTGTPERCTEPVLDAALAGGGMVTFNCGGGPVTITLTHQKDISSDTTVDGNGLITLDGNHAVRVFSVALGATLSIENLTIANGNIPPPGDGGGIHNSGTLTVTNSTFSGNSAFIYGGDGGGIANSGTLTVTNSTFSGNSARVGGGIANLGTLTVTNSTFSGNSSSYGGGIENNYFGKVTVTNCTFSGNNGDIGYTALGGGAVSPTPAH